MNDDEKAQLVGEVFDIFQLVLPFFESSGGKAFQWLYQPNPLLGGIPPAEMLARGQGKKLLRFIETCFEENACVSQNDKPETQTK